jgi:hypothetical protein
MALVPPPARGGATAQAPPGSTQVVLETIRDLEAAGELSPAEAKKTFEQAVDRILGAKQTPRSGSKGPLRRKDKL